MIHFSDSTLPNTEFPNLWLSLALAESASKGPSILLGFIFVLQRGSLLSVYTDPIVCWERATFFRCHKRSWSAFRSLCFSLNFSPPVLCYLHLFPTYMPGGVITFFGPGFTLPSSKSSGCDLVFVQLYQEAADTALILYLPLHFFGVKNVWTFAL